MSGGITNEQGYCDTCKYHNIRDLALKLRIPGEKWKKPCRDCDIERNYLWEPLNVPDETKGEKHE